MSPTHHQNPFPHLASNNHHITSPADTRYNCIAWAAGNDDTFWWPVPGAYWPQGVPMEVTESAFIAAYSTLGYEVTKNPDAEPDYEKVVIYLKNSIPIHASRQLPDGWWTSKLGQAEDINHQAPETVNGPLYGEARLYMRRRINNPKNPPWLSLHSVKQFFKKLFSK